MHDFPMHATIDVHLKEGMELRPHVNTADNSWLSLGSWEKDGWYVTLFGSPANLRKLAEALHQLADATERDVNRQRTLDNAPAIRRTKFVLEGEATTEIKLAA